MFLPHPCVKVSIVGSLCDREVACSASDRQGSNFESCVWRTVSSHNPQEVLLAQFSLYVHKGFEVKNLNNLISHLTSSFWPRWLIRSGCGSKIRGTGFEFRSGRMFVIEVVHIQSFKLFKGLECAVLSIVPCTIKNPLQGTNC